MRKLTSDAKNRIVEIESGPAEPVGNEPQDVAQARAWVKETRLEQLRAEILMLGQELASQPVRLEALRAQQDLAEFNLTAVQAQVAALEAAVNEARLQDTERAKVEARAAEIVAVGKHPLVVELAARNRRAERRDRRTGRCDRETGERRKTGHGRRNAHRTEFQCDPAEDRGGRCQPDPWQTAAGTASQPAGSRPFPEKGEGARAQDRARRRCRSFCWRRNAEACSIRMPMLRSVTSGMPPEDAEGIAGELHELAVSRLELVDKALAIQRAYLQAMAELDFAQQRQADAIERFDAFLDKRLLWVRSTAGGWAGYGQADSRADSRRFCRLRSGGRSSIP